MRERGIDKGGEWIADWLEHLQYLSEVKTPEEDKPKSNTEINRLQNQQNCLRADRVYVQYHSSLDTLSHSS